MAVVLVRLATFLHTRSSWHTTSQALASAIDFRVCAEAASGKDSGRIPTGESVAGRASLALHGQGPAVPHQMLEIPVGLQEHLVLLFWKGPLLRLIPQVLLH